MKRWKWRGRERWVRWRVKMRRRDEGVKGERWRVEVSLPLSLSRLFMIPWTSATDLTFLWSHNFFAEQLWILLQLYPFISSLHLSLHLSLPPSPHPFISSLHLSLHHLSLPPSSFPSSSHLIHLSHPFISSTKGTKVQDEGEVMKEKAKGEVKGLVLHLTFIPPLPFSPPSTLSPPSSLSFTFPTYLLFV